MTNDLFKPSKEMRESDALKANAEKAELIKAAETLKEYCHKHKKNDLCDKYTCNLYYTCMELYDLDVEYAMGFITETLMDDETIG